MPPDAPSLPPSGEGAWTRLDRPPLRSSALRRALVAPNGPLSRLELLPRTPSTNAYLAEQAGLGGWDDLSVVATDHQSAGRGRQGRTWSAPPRSAVAVSVLLRPGSGVPSSAWSWLPLLAGLAVAGSLREVGGLLASIKWPNDVLVPSCGAGSDPAKVCGVLAEVVTTPEGPAVVVGAGINVHQARDELPVPTATSLRLAGAATTDRDTVLRSCLRSLASWYLRWRDAGGDATRSGVAASVREACSTLGQQVRADMPGGAQPLLGTAEGLDDDGRLLVRRAPDGELVAVAAADVVHLRPQAPPPRAAGRGTVG